MKIKRYHAEEARYVHCSPSDDGKVVFWDDIQPLLRLLEAARELGRYLDEDIGMDKPELTDLRFAIREYDEVCK